MLRRGEARIGGLVGQPLRPRCSFSAGLPRPLCTRTHEIEHRGHARAYWADPGRGAGVTVCAVGKCAMGLHWGSMGLHSPHPTPRIRRVAESSDGVDPLGRRGR